jgi:hypothetical protein
MNMRTRLWINHFYEEMFPIVDDLVLKRTIADTCLKDLNVSLFENLFD